MSCRDRLRDPTIFVIRGGLVLAWVYLVVLSLQPPVWPELVEGAVWGVGIVVVIVWPMIERWVDELLGPSE